MLLIGICGASGSGKTTLAEELMQSAKVKCVMLSQDAYYRDHPDLSFAERCALNYDEPAIFDHDLLYQDVCALLRGQPVCRRQYDFSTRRRADTEEMIAPADVLIVEGIHAFYDERLMEKMSLRLYLDVDPDICLLRRIRRDMQERGRDLNSISAQYLATVKPMYEKYIRPYIRKADLVVPEGGKSDSVIAVLSAYLQAEVQKGRKQSL